MSRMFYTDAERAEQDRALLYSRIKGMKMAANASLSRGGEAEVGLSDSLRQHKEPANE